MDIDYTKTLEACEEIKTKLNELSALLFHSANQGISNEYEVKKGDLINWIEEIEFNITSHE
jgi:hypothetical protein